METQTIQVKERTPDGKKGARKLRKAGRVPAILYGHKETPVALDVDPRELRKLLRDSGLGRNTVFRLQGLARDVLAILKDTDQDPVRRDLVHVDLMEVRAADRVVVDVPVRLDGKAAGIIDGGVVQAVSRTLRLRCSPLSIPREIVVDVTPLRIGQSYHGSDVALPADVQFAGSAAATLVTVKAPRELETTTAAPTGETAVEGAAAESAEAKASPKAKEKE